MLNVLAKAIAILCCSACALCACSKAPTGQVVAVANGEEITRGELRSEAAARDLQTGEGATPGDLLQAVVDRKLWAQEAKRAKLDRDIEFILARRRAEEAALADLQIRALSDSVAVPAEEDVDRFLQGHPTAFVRQTVFSIDQINLRPERDFTLVHTLSKAKSLEQVSALLSRRGVVGQRSRTEWNSMFMPASLAAKLETLPPSTLFLHRIGNTMIAANVVAKTSVLLSYPDRKILARKSLTQQKINETLVAHLIELRASANIRLQPGFVLASSGSGRGRAGAQAGDPKELRRLYAK